MTEDAELATEYCEIAQLDMLAQHHNIICVVCYLPSLVCLFSATCTVLGQHSSYYLCTS